jgi:hypothetical protein
MIAFGMLNRLSLLVPVERFELSEISIKKGDFI